jgi:hypothetical protein
MNIAYALSLIALLILMPIGMVQAAPDPVAPIGLGLIGGPNTFEQNGQMMTAFYYSFVAGGPPAPSHFTMGACTTELADVVGWEDVVVGHDPTTAMTGIKLDNLALEPGGVLLFSVVMSGTFTSQPMSYRVKSGQYISYASTWGPMCDGATAVTLSGLSAEVDAGEIARNVVLLALIVSAGLLVWWALKKGKG